MSKIWIVAHYHFRKETSQRSFLFVLFGLPLFMALVVGLGALVTYLEEGDVVLGYVDLPGIIAGVPADLGEESVQFVAFAADEAARAALEAGEIDAYYVIAADYAETRWAELYCFDRPPGAAYRAFRDLVRYNLLADRPPAVVERLMAGSEVTVRVLDSGREFPGGDTSASHIVPLMVAAGFAFLVLTTSGYMLGVIVTEKENRTMEIVISSISTGEMMAGKFIGALGIALLQTVTWALFFFAAAWVGANVLELEWIQELDVNWRDVLMIAVVAVPAYGFIAAFATMLGSTLVGSQEAQQIGSLLFLPLFLPLYVVIPITQEPNGLLALIFSFVPLTAVTTFGLRNVLIEIPWWQVLVSAAVSLAAGVGMAWLAAKALRLSMLRYGQRLSLRELWKGGNSSRPPQGRDRSGVEGMSS